MESTMILMELILWLSAFLNYFNTGYAVREYLQLIGLVSFVVYIVVPSNCRLLAYDNYIFFCF
jgi:hypothetical protein